MAITKDDVILGPILTEEEVKECIDTSRRLLDSILDRADLHPRSCLERFYDIVMGEIAERSILKWLQGQGKAARSAVDKTSGQPDCGHDIILHSPKGGELTCSVKSSLSAEKPRMDDILRTFRLASKQSEIRSINIQVYFWLDTKGKPRVSTPSEKNMAIIGWCESKDLEATQTGSYATEQRPVVDLPLKDLRSMSSLLKVIQ